MASRWPARPQLRRRLGGVRASAAAGQQAPVHRWRWAGVLLGRWRAATGNDEDRQGDDHKSPQLLKDDPSSERTTHQATPA